MARIEFGGLGFLIAGVLFLIAALGPLLRQEPANATFLALGVVFLVLGYIRRRRSGPPPPPTGPPEL